MKLCLWCKKCKIRRTFSFYCRDCYHYLQRKYCLDIADYITYFQITYNKIVRVQDISFGSFTAIHFHFQHNLQITDKPLAELLEVILFLKVTIKAMY